jgi:hypothetical protein
MWRPRRKDSRSEPAGTGTALGNSGGGSTVAEAPSPPEAEFAESLEVLQAEIEELTAANQASPSRETERRLVRLRHLAGIRLIENAGGDPSFVTPDPERLPAADPLPEIPAAEVTPGLLRAGILRDGCLLVRGLVPREHALDLAEQIDRGFDLRERHGSTGAGSAAEGYYEEFQPRARFGAVVGRGWIELGGGLLAADAPMLNFTMMEMFRAAGLPQLVSGYLGEPALISVHKTTLRKADPAIPGAWHQDGFFMGQVRSLNLWLSLSRCGDLSPGLDIVPRRLDDYVSTATEEAVLDYTISQTKAEEAAAHTPIIRPIFEPGDALFFDELFLHKTGSEASMPNHRYAIENWFFGASGFPEEYAPVAV